MKIFYYDHHTFPLPENHRFPADKYRLLRERVQAAGLVAADDLVAAPKITAVSLQRAHLPSYLQRLEQGLLSRAEMRRIGLPWSPELINRVQYTVGATTAAARIALRDGLALSLGGGTHHACRDHGQGYCLYNDVVVAARTMQAEGRVRRVAVIDCDVHQGNGTAEIAASDPTIFTFSIHGEKNFPYRKIPGDLDIGLPDKTGDEAYLAALRSGLQQALTLARPELVVYLAGADVYERDRLGRLSLTQAGIGARDQLVLTTCRQAGLPVAVTMAGGYGIEIQETVAIQFQTVQLAVAASLSAP